MTKQDIKFITFDCEGKSIILKIDCISRVVKTQDNNQSYIVLDNGDWLIIDEKVFSKIKSMLSTDTKSLME